MKSLPTKVLLPCLLLAAVTLLFASGCAKKPAANGIDPTLTHDMSQDRDADFGYGFDERGFGESAIDEEGFGYGLTTEEVSGLMRVHFDFDRFTLSDEAQQRLVANAAYMQAHSEKNFRIEGHTDERGSDEYNLALGQRRALAAKNFLVTLGIDPQRLSVISYGEELPLDTSRTEEAFALNRRAEFKAIR